MCPSHETQWLNDDFENDMVSLKFTFNTASASRVSFTDKYNTSENEYFLCCYMINVSLMKLFGNTDTFEI